MKTYYLDRRRISLDSVVEDAFHNQGFIFVAEDESELFVPLTNWGIERLPSGIQSLICNQDGSLVGLVPEPKSDPELLCAFTISSPFTKVNLQDSGNAVSTMSISSDQNE